MFLSADWSGLESVLNGVQQHKMVPCITRATNWGENRKNKLNDGNILNRCLVSTAVWLLGNMIRTSAELQSQQSAAIHTQNSLLSSLTSLTFIFSIYWTEDIITCVCLCECISVNMYMCPCVCLCLYVCARAWVYVRSRSHLCVPVCWFACGRMHVHSSGKTNGEREDLTTKLCVEPRLPAVGGTRPCVAPYRRPSCPCPHLCSSKGSDQLWLSFLVESTHCLCHKRR